MNQLNRHIISSLNWNTLFDRKENAVQLQSRLSAWSNTRLQSVLKEVFDRMCPPEQTWKIGSLELDLGEIEYDQMEPELYVRVRKQLMEKLSDLINYPEKNTDVSFEILDEITSRLSLIESFLLTGIMPWNRSTEQESADRLLSQQLKNNRQAVVEMLWRTGAKHAHVRRRIAWQFADTTVVKIIEAIEPNNSRPIVDFADQLTELQREKPVVPGSASDLRKNVWHWVLNYLYTERGSVFNKLAFMKSTIVQMAAHHNVQYSELMQLIEEAVNKIKRGSGLLSDFVLTLHLLSAENKAVRGKEAAQPEQAVDHWQRLELFFLNSSLRKADSHQAEFNDLVVYLGRTDSKRLAALVRSVGKDKAVRMAAVADLQEISLEVIFSALLPTASSALTKSITFLHALGREMNLWKEKKTPWNAALKFAIENRNASADQEIFIAWCVTEITNELHKPAAEIFNGLLQARIPSDLKSTGSLEIYAQLVAAARKEDKTGQHSFHSVQIKELIDALWRHVRASTTEREAFLSVRAVLMKRINRHPKIAFDVLMKYPQKNKLQVVLPYLTTGPVTGILIGHAKPELQAILAHLMEVAEKLAANDTSAKIAKLLRVQLYEWALEAIIMQPGIGATRLLKTMLTQLSVELTGTGSAGFVLLYDELLASKNSLVKSVAEKMLSSYEAVAKQSLAVRLKRMMHRRNATRTDIAKMLAIHFSDSTFGHWRKSGSKEGTEILNFLLPEGEKRMEKLVAFYKALLVSQGRIDGGEPEPQLREIYWKCILDYIIYHENIAQLRKSFDAAVMYAFPQAGKIISRKKLKIARGEKPIALKNGTTLTPRNLFDLIGKCLESGNAEIEKDGIRYGLKELLEFGLELKPAEIRRMIAVLPLNETRLRLLKSVSSFPELSRWLMSDLRGEMNAAMEAMRVLYDLIVLIVPGTPTDKFLDAFWTEAWTVAATGSWSRDDLKKLIRTSFTKMAAELGVNAATLITEMKDRQIRITPLLRDNLVACFPAFAVLPESEKETAAGRRLIAFEKKGLLDHLVEQLVAHKNVPLWLGDTDEQEVKVLIHEIIVHYPVKFLQVLKRQMISEQQMRWLHETISFRELTVSISQLNSERRSLLFMLDEFYTAIGKISVSGISPAAIREILFRKLVKAWTNNNWKIVAVENIWNELVWDVCIRHNLPKEKFLREIKKFSGLFSPALKIALDQMTRPTVGKTEAPVITVKQKKTTDKKPGEMKTQPAGVAVRNAGVVLLSSYVPMLFERLQLTSGGKFTSTQAQNDAVHYLQYVITGLAHTEEPLLPLNKVLCGLPLSFPVTDGITISDTQKNLVDGLIKAAISHWPAIGETSIEGFRGNWLVRDGVLTEQEDKWTLVVEKRAYDVLLNKSPYSFSIIRYPWMDKSLQVTWPY